MKIRKKKCMMIFYNLPGFKNLRTIATQAYFNLSLPNLTQNFTRTLLFDNNYLIPKKYMFISLYKT